MTRKVPCATCGTPFLPKKSKKGGRPQKHCPKCQKPRGQVIDLDAARKRKNARRRSKAAAVVAGDVAIEMHRSRELAAALSMFEDPREAARYVGIDEEGAELDRLVELARTAHAGVVDGDRAELGRQLIAASFLLLGSAVKNRDQIAPRDLPHVARALAQVHALLVGDQVAPFVKLQMFLVDETGTPYDPNAIPQLEAKVEPEDG